MQVEGYKMRQRRWLYWLLLPCLSCALPWAVIRSEGIRSEGIWSEEPTGFLRFQKVGKDGGRLQTGIVTYKNSSGQEVTLFAAVHIGDGKYYWKLQEQFAECDALLYEMVKPKSATPEPGGGSSWVSFLQRAMKFALKLEFQLDAIDYRKRNFVHADMDPQTFARMQRKQGESILSLMVNLWLEGLKRGMNRKGPQLGPEEFMEILRSKDRSRRLKLFFAEEMQDLEGLLSGIESGGRKSVILSGRNKVAMGVLKEQLAEGERKLGIFYGAAHMPDMEERLMELGFKKVQERWITAWDMPPKTPARHTERF